MKQLQQNSPSPGVSKTFICTKKADYILEIPRHGINFLINTETLNIKYIERIYQMVRTWDIIRLHSMIELITTEIIVSFIT